MADNDVNISSSNKKPYLTRVIKLNKYWRGQTNILSCQSPLHRAEKRLIFLLYLYKLIYILYNGME